MKNYTFRKLVFLSIFLFLPFLPFTHLAAAQSGTVKWFNTAAGFGYIDPDNGGDEVFVHFSVIEGSVKRLSKGQRVLYEAVKDKGKLKATWVKIIG